MNTRLHLYSQQNVEDKPPSVFNVSRFGEYGPLPDWILNRCEVLGFSDPTPVQKLAFPAIFSGKDIVLQAQTGSGKTLSYALPVISAIDPNRAAIQAVIIVPTRELGLQVTGVLKQLTVGSPKKIMVMSVMLGSNNRRQQLWASAEPPHIVVGNPKSLQKLVNDGRLRLNAVSFVVLDEVDACLNDPNVRQDLHKLLSRKLSTTFKSSNDVEEGPVMQENLVYSDLTKNQRDVQASKDVFRNHRQTIMCSATIPQRQHFASSCLKNGWTDTLPEVIHVSPNELVPQQVAHEFVECSQDQRWACLKYLLKKEVEDWLSSSSSSTSSSTVRTPVRVPIEESTSEKRESLMSRLRSNRRAVKTTIITSEKEAVNEGTGPGSAGLSTFKALVFTDDSDPIFQSLLIDSSSSSSSLTNDLNDILPPGKGDGKLTESLQSVLQQTYLSAMPMQKTGPGQQQGYCRVTVLTEQMSIDSRAASLSAFREGAVGVLICTGVASRGLDIPDATHVIQLKLPKSVEDYIHQTGRIGRLGRRGKAITIIQPGSQFAIDRYSNEIGMDIKKRNLKVKGD